MSKLIRSFLDSDADSKLLVIALGWMVTLLIALAVFVVSTEDLRQCLIREGKNRYRDGVCQVLEGKERVDVDAKDDGWIYERTRN